MLVRHIAERIFNSSIATPKIILALVLKFSTVILNSNHKIQVYSNWPIFAMQPTR